MLIFRKRKLFVIWLSLVALAPNFTLPSLWSAETAVSSLQQEILSAKEKQTDITGRFHAIESALDAEKEKMLESEAQNLMQSVLDAGYRSQKQEIRLDESSKEFVKPVAEEPYKKVRLSDKLLAKKVWRREERKDNRDWSMQNFGGAQLKKPETKLSEGEGLYKVAVSDGKITVKEAVDIGLANNLGVQAAKKKIEVAQAKLVEAKRALFPTVQAFWQTNGGVLSGFYKGENRAVRMNQPLFYGGELILTVKQAEENLKSSKVDYEKTRNDLVHQIRTAYYGAVKAEYNLQYQIELLRVIQTVYQRVRKEREDRLISEVDFLNAESQYEQVYFQAESGQNDLKSAYELLYESMEITNNLPLPIDLELKLPHVRPEFSQLLELALRQNPDLRIKKFSELSAKYGVDVFKAKKLPRFDLRGSYGYEGETRHDSATIAEGKADNDLEKEWYLGVHGSMPLGASSVEYDQIKHIWGPTISAYQGSVDWTHKGTFNLFDKLADITDEKNAEATYLQSRSDFDKARNELSSKLREDFFNLQKTRIQIDSATAKIRYQQKQNAINEYLLSLQETPVATYMEGLIEYAQSRFAFIQAVVDHHLAISSLSVEVGDPYYFDVVTTKEG